MCSSSTRGLEGIRIKINHIAAISNLQWTYLRESLRSICVLFSILFRICSVLTANFSPFVGLDIYTKYPDGGFVVEAGDLSFSVMIFTICAFLCLTVLVARRAKYGGELGGTKHGKRISAAILVTLWIVYICISSAKSMSSRSAD